MGSFCFSLNEKLGGSKISKSKSFDEDGQIS